MSSGLNHNAIYRGKNLGTINSNSDWVNFRAAHGISNYTYTDLYLGDYVTIKDGTYNAEWMVAGFDLMHNRGNSATARGVLMIPRVPLFNDKMNSSDTTTGGYIGSAMYTSVLPTVVTRLQGILGGYLLPMQCLLTKTVNNTIASMAGNDLKGASTDWEWKQVYAVLMSEVQICGSTLLSSSFKDVGEACFKLPVFNFISPVEFGRSGFWLRSVARSANFAFCSLDGVASLWGASTSYGVRPLILVG